MLHVVSIRSAQRAGTASKVVGGGFLIDRSHVLTAWHVWTDASANGCQPMAGILPGHGVALPLTLVDKDAQRDAAIARVVDWEADVDFTPPVLADRYATLDRRPVEVHAITPTSGEIMRAGNYSVSSYDNETQEFELTPEVAQGNSGGALVHDGRVVGLVCRRAAHQPIARAIGMHVLLPWVRRVLGALPVQPPPEVQPPEDTIGPVSPPGIRGLSRRLGSIHLHVDGAQARSFVEDLVERHNARQRLSELAYVVASQPGPQRRQAPRIYDLHNPGRNGQDELDFFSTSQLHPGPGLPTRAERRALALEVLDQLCRIDPMGEDASGVVLELERVVGTVDDNGNVSLAQELSLRGSPLTLDNEQAMRLFAPFNRQRGGMQSQSAYELHFSLDIDRLPDDKRPPVALEDLVAMSAQAAMTLGGWFLFHDQERWAYRSNEFVAGITEQSLRTRWTNLRAALAADTRPRLQSARLRLLAEEALAVWRTPLALEKESLRTLDSLAAWERDFVGLEEFWVLLPNFLGDQNEEVRKAMLSNFDRDVRYTYFLRSNADARRWLDFRDSLSQEHEKADSLLSAYVLDFRPGSAWADLTAFVANPGRPLSEGYALRVDESTNRALYGDRLSDERLKTVVDAHARALGNDQIVSWRLVQGASAELEITGVCASLLHEPDEAMFERLDGHLALLASQFDGSVEVYGSRSITAVFEGSRAGFALAQQFAAAVLQRGAAWLAGSGQTVLRVGLHWGRARVVHRAIGPMWTGAAIRHSRRVLDQAPERCGAFASRDRAGWPPFEPRVTLQPVGDTVVELSLPSLMPPAAAGHPQNAC